MIDRRTMLLGSVATRMAGPFGTSCARSAPIRGGAESGLVEEVEGWRVRVEPPLAARKADRWNEASPMLRCQLAQIARKLPPRAVEALRQIEIHVGEVAAEKPRAIGGRFGSEALAVEIGEARTFLDAARERPWSLFHALALVYYRARLPGPDRAGVAAAHAAAAASGKYGRVLRADGRRLRHPALNGPADYFAAGTTAFFGTSDHYPFVPPQFREVDAVGYEFVARVWREANSARPGGPVLASSLGPPYKVTARSELAS